MSDQIPLPTVDVFTSELESVGPKWYDLGIFLGISTHELDIIGEFHGSKGTQRCIIELFKCFQSRTKPVSWNDIVDALTKIHNNYIADRIRDKYIQTVSSSCPLSPPYTEKQVRTDSQVMGTDSASKTHDDKHICVDTKMHFIDLDDRIRHNVQTTSSLSPLRETTPRSEKLDNEKTGSDSQMMETDRVSEIHDNEYIYIDKTISSEFNKISKEFTKLVVIIKEALKKKSASIIDQLQEVLYDQCKLEPLSTEESSFDKVFGRVRQHYCFLNYHIFECLVDMFLSDEKLLQQLLVDYTNKLEKFKESIMMKDLMKLMKEKRDLCGNHKIIELKTRDFWGSVVLNKFVRLAKLIFQNLYDCAAQIRIEDGCICVSWVIPDIDTSVLVTVSPDLLTVVGVISLKIDDKVLYEGPNEGCHILESAFLQAVVLGNVRAFELLLAVSTCEVVNLALYNGITPLMVASYNGHSVVVSTLLTSGADSNMADNDGWTPLMVGSQNGHNEVAELLLKDKVDFNACLKNGITAIYIASQNGHSVVVSTLLTSGADPNMAANDGWTPLMIGSQNGHNEVVELLLKAKVNPISPALYLASQNGHSVVVSTLLTSGADPNIRTGVNGWTPLMIASAKGHTEVAKQLIEHGDININCQAVGCITALHLASRYGHINIVRILLESGANSRLVNSEGKSPLDLASRYRRHDIVKLLYEFRPLVGLRSISKLSLTSISTTDTGFHGSEDSRSIITELSGYSDLRSLDSNTVAMKPNERVDEMESDKTTI